MAPSSVSTGPKRADARRNAEALLETAAALFVTSGVEVPVREIAAQAGVGVGTIYRHFPTRSDLIVAVYRYQVEACAAAGPDLLSSSASPYAALERWIGLFVDFLTTKHGLAAVLGSNRAEFDSLHAFFLEQLVPVCAHLLQAATAAGEVRSDVSPLELMRGVGSLCAGVSSPTYRPRLLVAALVGGLRVSPAGYT